jgi:hypothetical protein
MSAPTTSYSVLPFQQRRDGGPKTVLFCARAEDVAAWGGVPQKSSRFLKGFQRSEDKTHWEEISDYFETEGNISPTAIVVAFKPGCAELVETTGAPLGILKINYVDHSGKTTQELAKLVYAELLPVAGADIASAEAAGAGQAQQVPVDEDDDEPEDETGTDGALSVGTSHLADFLRFLNSDALIAQAIGEDEATLRKMLLNLLQPATIVDGQHRTRGAAFLEKGITFPVVGLIDADWREQVFQFVVINQRARPIPAEFLSAIISNSLNNNDIQEMSSRLEQAGVKLENTKIMDLVHGDQRSPFVGMIDFKIQGAKGRLTYPGMLTLARRFRGLRTHDTEVRFSGFFKEVFADAMNVPKYTDRRRLWQNSVWFEYFAAFWDELRTQVCDEGGGYEHLWGYNTNLLKIVTLQELQNLFLQWLSDRRDKVHSVEELRTLAKKFAEHLKPIFFEKAWKLPSLQSGTGRKYLRAALSAALKSPRVDYKKIALFTGVTGEQD